MTRELSLAEVEQLRRNAKRAARTQDLSHTQALDEQARQKGFPNWATLMKHAEQPAEEQLRTSASLAASGAPAPSPTTAMPVGLPLMNATRHELELIIAIVERFERLMGEPLGTGSMPTRMELMMDIEACHSNGCPLDLVSLLEAARDLDFAHDVGGIYRHLDRRTGKLGGFFLPRYAMREASRQA